MPELADTLDRLAVEGADSFYLGELADRIAAHVPVTLGDLARYEVIERRPLEASFRGAELRTNPPPSGGGRLVVAGLEALGTAEASPLGIVRAMEAQDAMRRAEAVGGTTHISAVDSNGDAASLSCSLGSSGGVVVPGTGTQLNNMLGELHLVGEPGQLLGVGRLGVANLKAHACTTTAAPPRRGSPAPASEPSCRISTAETPPKNRFRARQRTTG